MEQVKKSSAARRVAADVLNLNDCVDFTPDLIDCRQAAARILGSRRVGTRVFNRFESMGTWLLLTSYVLAPMRFATKRCNSGRRVRSFVTTMLGGRLRSPSDTIELLCEQVDSRREVRHPNYLLLLFGKVSRLPSGHNSTRREPRLTQLEAFFWFQRMLSTLWEQTSTRSLSVPLWVRGRPITMRKCITTGKCIITTK
jgi:hypothetical protein